MNKITNEFNEINSPQELLNFITKHINYGYLSKNKKVYHYNDKDFNKNWYNEYILQSNKDILKTLHGNCWDQVELERYWFEKHNYEIKTIFEMVNLDYINTYPTHTFLIYKDENNNWNWFEHSDNKNQGIHKFSSLNELLKYQYNKYIKLLKTFNIKDEEIKKIILTEFEKPISNISAEEYLKFVINSKKINKDVII